MKRSLYVTIRPRQFNKLAGEDEYRGFIELDGKCVYTTIGFTKEECKKATRDKLVELIIDCTHAIKEVDNNV